MYTYLVVHIKSGRKGIGSSVPIALEQALGHKEHLRFMATTPPRGFYWGTYKTRTLGTTSNLRRTVIKKSKTYEQAPVYQSEQDRTLIMAVFRSTDPHILDLLPDNSHVKTPAVPKQTQGNSKGKRTRS